MESLWRLLFFIYMSSTIGTDTELSAVNSILGSIGQAPLTTLDMTNPEVGYVYNILTEARIDTLNEGWVFNREEEVTLSPDITTKYITFPADALRVDLSNNHHDRTMSLVKREGKLYDKVQKKFTFDTAIKADIVRIYDFEDIPSVFQRYVTYRASTRAATQLVSNPQLVSLLAQQEAMARAACMEYECNQGDHNILGFPANTVYNTYQPYRGLMR